tara:strand:- start:1963 stop:2466 length:504 start_codon:yes stop_codon:yes gene_type:complete
MAYEIMARVLFTEGEQMKSLLQQELIAQDHIASGKLHDSFDVDFNIVGSSINLSITNNAGYAIAVDEGVGAGTVVGITKLIKWVKDKQARGKMLPFDNEIAITIAQRVQDSIKEGGTTSPRGFIGNAMETAEKIGMFERIAAATGLEVDALLGQSEKDDTITITATI